MQIWLNVLGQMLDFDFLRRVPLWQHKDQSKHTVARAQLSRSELWVLGEYRGHVAVLKITDK